MAYIKYDFILSQGVYSDYDRARKTFVGDRLSKKDICAALDMLPLESPKLWELLLKYEIVLRFGKAAGTYYMMPKELPPYTRFESIEQEFYNGASRPSLAKESKSQEREIERIPLTEDFCIDFLKKRNYIVFKVTPDFDALSNVLTPEFLLQNSNAELK